MPAGDPVEHATDTARHLTPNVPVARPVSTADEIRRQLAGHRYDSVADVAVCEGGRLCGLIPIAELLAAEGSTTAAALMDPNPPVVHSASDREEAAWKAVRHGEGSLAVVDGEGVFLGLVTPPQLLAVLLAEHEQDLARLSGVVHRDDIARTSSYEPIPRRFAHRTPWLLAGLAGALAAATLVGRFEGQLERNVTLAFFVPAIVYLADAVGTQTETLMVRALSAGVRVREIIGREIFTGVLIGLLLAAIAGPVSWLMWGDETAAIAFAAALVVACAMASVIAVGLPTILQWSGVDPAYGSGPIATVIQDILSIAVYLGIAVMLGA